MDSVVLNIRFQMYMSSGHRSQTLAWKLSNFHKIWSRVQWRVHVLWCLLHACGVSCSLRPVVETIFYPLWDVQLPEVKKLLPQKGRIESVKYEWIFISWFTFNINHFIRPNYPNAHLQLKKKRETYKIYTLISRGILIG